MKNLKSLLNKWLVKLRQVSPWHQTPQRTDRALHNDDVARWVDEGGAGSDPRRAI